ncbi:MAG: hypothetical protein U0324_02180 [Polyangiales bacterium]
MWWRHLVAVGLTLAAAPGVGCVTASDVEDAAPPPACQTGWGACGDAAACDTDLLNDDRSCGACGSMCAADTRCVDGACAATGVRLLAPISTHRVLSARPWLRWEMPPDADLARVEVCDDRACDRVTHRWEVGGASLRPPSPLPVGVHFWRVSARRGGAFGAATARPWLFEVRDAVPAGEATVRPPLFDIDGDGLVDRAVSHRPPVDYQRPSGTATERWSIEVWRSTARSSVADVTLEGSPSWRQFDSSLHGEEHSVSELIALGDVNGDGYGDLGVVDALYEAGWWGVNASLATLYLYLGAPAGRPLRRASVFLGDLAFADARLLVAPVGDRDGDGYGDLGGYISPIYSTGGFTIFGGRRRGFPLERTGDMESHLARGDFNGDGYEDLGLSYTGNGMYGWSIGVRPGAPTRPLPRAEGSTPCAELALVGDWFWAGVRVVDHDGDGYDDLQVSNAGSGASVVLRGSATGLARPACTVVSRPH